jgi:long-subunit fatty acid transport protein
MRRPHPLRFLALACGLGALLWAGPAQAQNGLEHLNQGAKGAGRAGASTALADDAHSQARNPALLTQLQGTRVDGTFLYRLERTRRRNATDDVLTENGSLWPIPFLAFSADLTGPEDLDDPAAGGPYLGFGVFQPMQGIAAPTATLALRLTETLSVGVSVNVLLTYLRLQSGGSFKGGGRSPVRGFQPGGTVRVHHTPDGAALPSPQPYDPGTGRPLTWAEVFDAGFTFAESGDPNAPSSGGGESARIDYELELYGAGVAAQLGLLWTPREDLSVGLSVRTPGIVFDPQGSAELDLTHAVEVLEQTAAGWLIAGAREQWLPDRGEEGFSAEYDLELDDLIVPASVSVGVAWWPLPRWVLTLDLRWVGWSHSLDDMEVRASGGENRDLNEITGGGEVTYTIPLDWKDQIVVAVGTTVAVTDWLLLRAGYNHGENPIPPTGLVSNSAVIEDHLSCGVGLRFGGWDVDLAYVHGLPNRVDLDGAAFKVELHQLYVGVGYAF